MHSSELLMRLNQIKQLEVQQKALEKQIEALKGSVKDYMTERKTDEIWVGNCSVSWKPYTVHRFDSSSFKTEHGDLYKQYSKAVEAKRFVVR